MQPIKQALNDVEDLFAKVVGQPAPQLDPSAFAAFPPGVDPIKFAVQEVEQLKLLHEQMALAPKPSAWTPVADSFLADDAYVLRVELPGVEREGLKVVVAGGECVVCGERRHPSTESSLRPLSVERPWGAFERRFVLPAGSHPDQVSARYADGVLELRVAREAAGEPRETKVEVV